MVGDKQAAGTSDLDILARLTTLWRGDSQLSDEEADAIGERIHAVDAPRVGNGTAAYSSLGPWDRARFRQVARVAVAAYLEMALADKTGSAPG